MWYQCNTVVKISIHALLAESDSRRLVENAKRGISIHALLAESDCAGRGHVARRHQISIHALLAESDIQPHQGPGQHPISIHALLAESDHRSRKFPSAGGISIHALLAESDVIGVPIPALPHDFYPRSPCGERPAGNKAGSESFKFLSTLSLRRATLADLQIRGPLDISIHALLAESDWSTWIASTPRANFYPRSPCGERHANLRRHCSNDNFYPRSPCGERHLLII